jgi:hypothetical protein
VPSAQTSSARTAASTPAATPSTQSAAGFVAPLATIPAVGVPADANPQVRSVVEAVRSGTHPERLSIAVDPAPFDPAAFARNPQAYLNVVEPARVYQTAPAGPTAVPLVATVDHTIRLPALGSTPLVVIGTPGSPVSFTILDGGQFENGLASITVLAGDDGKATATYSATPGTVDEVQILVGSPMTVGTLTMTVHVADPAATVSTR